LRKITRSSSSGALPETEWRNRILELSLVGDDPESDWNYAVGRITSRVSVTSGPFNGMRLDRRVGERSRLGIFSGFAPRWQNLDFDTQDRVAGATFRLDRGENGSKGTALFVSGAGRYKRGEISRETLTLSGDWRSGGSLALSQFADIDLNRGWRKAAMGGKSLRLTSFSASGRWTASKHLSLRLGWDNRERVRTLDSRELPDSLFEDTGRRGLGVGLRWRGEGGRSFSLRASLKRRSGGARDASWNARLHMPAWLPGALDLEASLRGISGPWVSGLLPQVSLGRRLGRSSNLKLALGHPSYDSNAVSDRDYSWARLSAGIDLGRGVLLSAELRRDWGGDRDGNRLWLSWRQRLN